MRITLRIDDYLTVEYGNRSYVFELVAAWPFPTIPRIGEKMIIPDDMWRGELHASTFDDWDDETTDQREAILALVQENVRSGFGCKWDYSSALTVSEVFYNWLPEPSVEISLQEAG